MKTLSNHKNRKIFVKIKNIAFAYKIKIDDVEYSIDIQTNLSITDSPEFSNTTQLFRISSFT